ncbi:MAG: F0F1 ATP synthase subunit A [Oscillibacter sp.]|nr:F0F1 ATP synthase subunit A [Oscillibacter sp.]
MERKKRAVRLTMFGCAALLFLLGALLTGGGEHHESIQETMRDAVLHTTAKIGLPGIEVNPGLVSAFTVSGVLILLALLVRLLVIPRFQVQPKGLQLLLEQLVGLFDGLAKSNSPHKNRFLGAYVFTAGTYIFVGTIFELFGVQAVTTHGESISLPAPLSDINGAIALGVLSYCVILSGGVAANGLKGVGMTLKDFSLPISMSFRLFGALLSGALVTELVYYYIHLSFVLPVVVGVLFTLLHALIQAYVLTMLTALFYGEVSEPAPKKEKKPKKSQVREAPGQTHS